MTTTTIDLSIDAGTMPPDPRLWSLAGALATHARLRPDAPCLSWSGGEERSYAEVFARATATAHGFARIGVERGDMVALLLPNAPGFLDALLGVIVRGAVEVPVNLHYKHRSLVHVLEDARARVLVVASQQAPKLLEVADQLHHLEQLVIDDRSETGGPLSPELRRELAARWTLHRLVDLIVDEPDLPHFDLPDPRELLGVLYTSGTTGPAKGIMLRHAHVTVSAWAHLRACELSAHDRYLVVMPLFHSNAQVVQLVPAMIAGASLHLWPEFSATRWLDQVRRSRATVTNTLGVMTEFLHAQEPRDDDADNPLRVVQAIPAPARVAVDFERRFAVRLVGAYGLTDAGMISYRQPGAPLVPGGSGTTVDAFEVVVADPDTDQPLPAGEVGEILVRPRVPFGFMAGYWRRPEATVEAWRNLWMHTGDAGWFDDTGELFFHDRLKDSLRVRGENVSSAELEAEITAHPAVVECAAVAVPYEHGEDDIKVVVVPTAPGAVTARELMDFCVERLPYFAVPRYVEFLDDLPRTPTAKVRKIELRDRGVTPATWDRVEAGYQVPR